MTFIATNILPADAYKATKNIAVQVQRLAENRSAEWAIGGDSLQVLAMVDNMVALRAALQIHATVPGIAQYAKDQEDDQTYDVVTEFNAMIAAMDAVIAEVVATMPVDDNDWLLLNKINADGSLTPRTFTGAQLAGLRTELDLVVAAIS